MAKYVYPAIFSPEDEWYNVRFPDVEGCLTCGVGVYDAIAMAQDALPLMLMVLEDEGKTGILGPPSEIRDIKLEDGEFATYITADTDQYRKLNRTRAIKKTLSIPEWLNELAVDKGVNFSQILQDALKNHLGIDEPKNGVKSSLKDKKAVL